MSDVFLRPKSPTDKNGRLGRVPSRRSQFLSRFLEDRSSERERKANKEQLIERGIYRPEAVFGNHLANMPCDNSDRVPDFLYRCIKKLETMISTVGIYRVNGDAASVQKIRLDVDKDNYKSLESCQDVTVLASTLKLFFHELPEPLITKSVRERLCPAAEERDKTRLVALIQDSLRELPTMSLRVLIYLLVHLKKVADDGSNKMGVKNLATVFSPNLVHSVKLARRPESILTEMEYNNIILEQLIELVHHII